MNVRKLLLAACVMSLGVSVSFAKDGQRKTVRTEPAASAKTSGEKIGLGFNNQLFAGVGGLTSISLRYWTPGEIGVEGFLGFTSGDTNSLFGVGGKFLGILKREQNLDLYAFGMLGIENYSKLFGVSVSNTEIAVGAGLGVEYFFPGLPNLGFSTEFGIAYGGPKDAKQFQTMSWWIPNAGVHYYFK